MHKPFVSHTSTSYSFNGPIFNGLRVISFALLSLTNTPFSWPAPITFNPLRLQPLGATIPLGGSSQSQTPSGNTSAPSGV
jgi:hypothetical protein